MVNKHKKNSLHVSKGNFTKHICFLSREVEITNHNKEVLIDTGSYFHCQYNSTHSFMSDNFIFRLPTTFLLSLFFLVCVPCPLIPRTNIKAVLNYQATDIYSISLSEIARFIDHVRSRSYRRIFTKRNHRLFLCFTQENSKFNNVNMYTV